MFRFLQTTFFPTTPNPCLSFRFISTTSKSKGNPFTVSYLIDTCGFSPQRAASVSKNMNLKSQENSDSVIQLFKDLGFSQTQISTVIGTYPRSLEKQIIPCFDFFNAMFHSKESLMKAIIRHSGILYDLDRCSAPNLKLLRQEGVPESNIVKLVEYFPRSLKLAHKPFKDAVEEVKELEINPLRLNFVVAIHVKIFINRSMWARKEGIYRRWGWTDNEIRAAFRIFPFCMSVSDKKIEGIMDFLVNKLGYESSAIARCPVVTSLSLEKRIIPRGSVILVLLSKGLVNQLKLDAIFKSVEKVFLDKFIYRHNKEADELLKLYRAKLALAR